MFTCHSLHISNKCAMNEIQYDKHMKKHVMLWTCTYTKRYHCCNWCSIEKKRSYISTPQISQAPPKTVKQLLWKISWLHYTRIKSIKEYSKIKECCVWCLYWTRTIQKNVHALRVPHSFTITKQRTRGACSSIISTGILPACGFSFYGEQVPKGPKHLIQQQTLNCQKYMQKRDNWTFIYYMLNKKRMRIKTLGAPMALPNSGELLDGKGPEGQSSHENSGKYH